MSTELTPTVLQAQDIAYAQEMARIAQEAGIVPPNTKAATISAIILAGREMGMQPFHALRSLYFVQGRLLMSVQAQLALARRAGVKVVELKDEPNACKVILARGSEQVECTYSMDDARKAGLLDKANSNWAKYPRQMLRWRAIGDALRIIAPDVLLGVYDPNEFTAEFTEPAEPAEHAEHAEPVKRVIPAKPAESVKRVIPAKPAKPAKPEPAKPAEPAETAEPVKPAEPEPAKPAEPEDDDIEPIDDFFVPGPSSIEVEEWSLMDMDPEIRNSWLRRLHRAAHGKFKSDQNRREWLQQNFKKSSFKDFTLGQAREAIRLLRTLPYR